MKFRILFSFGLLLLQGTSLLAQEQGTPSFITLQNYRSLLSEMGASDPHSLYEPTAGIARSGDVGNYCYQISEQPSGEASEQDSMPMLSKLDAMRCCNWLATRSGIPNTEAGVYELDGERILSTNPQASCRLEESEEIDPLLKSTQVTFHLTGSNATLSAGEEVVAGEFGFIDEIIDGIFLAAIGCAGGELARNGEELEDISLEGSEIPTDRFAAAGPRGLDRARLMDASDPFAIIPPDSERQISDIKMSPTGTFREDELLEHSPASGSSANEKFVDSFLKKYSANFKAFEELPDRRDDDAFANLAGRRHDDDYVSTPGSSSSTLTGSSKSNSDSKNIETNSGESAEERFKEIAKNLFPESQGDHSIKGAMMHAKSLNMLDPLNQKTGEEFLRNFTDLEFNKAQKVFGSSLTASIHQPAESDAFASGPVLRGEVNFNEHLKDEFAGRISDHTAKTDSSGGSVEKSHEKASSLAKDRAIYDPKAILPRSGLSTEECVATLKDFINWRDEIASYSKLKENWERALNAVRLRGEAARNYYAWPDKKLVYYHRSAIEEAEDAERAFNKNIETIKQLGQRLDNVATHIAPFIPESKNETYPQFLLFEGTSLEEAKQAYRERQSILASGNSEKVENYLLHNFASYFDRLRYSWAKRQALLNQQILFENKHSWLDFSDPLKGPEYSTDPQELAYKANQAHAAFLESAVMYITKVFGRHECNNFFKRSAEKLAKCSLDLKIGYSDRNFISSLYENGVVQPEVKRNLGVMHFEGKSDAKDYLDRIFGTETKISPDQRGKIGASSSTRKHFLAQQHAYNSYGKSEIRLYDERGERLAATFQDSNPVTSVDLFHRQSIKAASLLDQYRIMALSPLEREMEVNRLQALTPEEREADLFKNAGITDWQLPSTPEELASYIKGEQFKLQQEEVDRKKEVEAAAAAAKKLATSSSSGNNSDPLKTESKTKFAEEELDGITRNLFSEIQDVPGVKGAMMHAERTEDLFASGPVLTGEVNFNKHLKDDFVGRRSDHTALADKSASSGGSAQKKNNKISEEQTKLPRTGLTVTQCAKALEKFINWRSELENYKSLKEQVGSLASTASWKKEDANKYYFYPDKEVVRLRDAAIQAHERAQADLQASASKIKTFGGELNELAEFFTPIIPEKVGEKYPKFWFSEGASLERTKKNKEAYRRRNDILNSRNNEKREDYLLYNDSFSSSSRRLQWSYLNRQAMLTQYILFSKEGYWLDFSDPLKGPEYSTDLDELNRRANQAHTNFMESATMRLMSKFRAMSTGHKNGDYERKNFFTLPADPLLENIKKHPFKDPFKLILDNVEGDLLSLTKEITLTDREIQARRTLWCSQTIKELSEEKRAAQDYFHWAVGTNTKFGLDDQGELTGGWPNTRKYFLIQQYSGDFTLVLHTKDEDLIALFSAQEPVQPYVDLFHNQSIKAASLLDQYRIMGMPSLEREMEVNRLQALAPQEREAELFKNAGIEDWRLPATPEELQDYVAREQEKCGKVKAAEATKTVPVTSSSSNSSYYEKQRQDDEARLRAEQTTYSQTYNNYQYQQQWQHNQNIAARGYEAQRATSAAISRSVSQQSRDTSRQIMTRAAHSNSHHSHSINHIGGHSSHRSHGITHHRHHKF